MPPGRPHVLDDSKRREICALFSAGCNIRLVARYVNCSVRTIHRETLRDSMFRDQVRRAKLAAQINPLNAMRQAAATHWRAAAWMLERTCPQRFAPGNFRRIDPADLKQLFHELFEVIDREIPDRQLADQVFRRVKSHIDQFARQRDGNSQRHKRRRPQSSTLSADFPDPASYDSQSCETSPESFPDQSTPQQQTVSSQTAADSIPADHIPADKITADNIPADSPTIPTPQSVPIPEYPLLPIEQPYLHPQQIPPFRIIH